MTFKEWAKTEWGIHANDTDTFNYRLAQRAWLACEAGKRCAWTNDIPDGSWRTSCGNAWCFVDGGPVDNGVKYCQFCGGAVAIEKENAA